MRKALISLLLSLPLAAAPDLDFKEAFADPATREIALARLVPQTRDWFFHHALNHQLAGRADAFRRTMEDWKAVADAEDSKVRLDGYQSLETRELLLRYQADPQKSTAALIKLLDLKFEDSRPDAQADQKLPDRLDPARISAAAFEQVAADRSNLQPYRGYSQERMLRELDHVGTFDGTKTRYFLENLRRADHPGVVPLILRSLDANVVKPRIAFGTLPIHNLLTRPQLDELLAAHPWLASYRSFATRYMETLLPGAETDLALDLPAHAAHLAACKDLVVQRGFGDPSIAAHVLYHHLSLQRALGQFPLDDFRAYLALPRATHTLLRVAKLPDDQPTVDLSRDLRPATACPPVRSDSQLIEDYLQHFLAAADTPDAFGEYFEEKSLRRLHARAKLLAGADPVQWGAALDPAQVLAMQKETRIAFAPGQPVTLPAGAAVRIALDLKNTPDLLVRIFELDLPAWIEREGSEPPVDLDLDGLVPHHEHRLTFDKPPLVLHRQIIDLPELDGPGAWIVECVSRGTASRALVRKGRLVPYVEHQARGQGVRVFDDAGNLIPDAEVALGSETFRPGENGTIFIPDSLSSLRSHGLVRHGKLAVPVSLAPRRDDIALQARFHLDREQLLAERQANLSLRLKLASHDHELPLEWIEKPSLVMTASLVGGLTTERVIAEDLKLSPRMFVPFQVPADTLALKFRLTGTVTARDGADPLPLSAEQSYSLNGILGTGRIAAAFFTRDAEGHRVELRGRNGEPLASRPLTVDFTHRDHLETITLALRPDDRGVLSLGPLTDISEVKVTGSDIAPASYRPDEDGGWIDLPDHLHLSVNEEARLPLVRFMAVPDRTRVSLIETRDGNPLRDHFDKLAVENRRLVLRGLPPGDFTLRLDGASIPVRVSGGIDRGGLLVSTARILPRHAPSIPFIAAATVEAGSLVVRVEGATPGTRVSLIGSRFMHPWAAGDALQPFARPEPDLLVPGFTACAFLEDKRLGDEMRYIIDRRAAKTFPGSLLPRPGLLVNRWSQDDIVQAKQTGDLGEDGSMAGGGRGVDRRPPPKAKPDSRPAGTDGGPSIDFLAHPSVIRYDLEVGANGLVQVPVMDFAACQFIDVVAADPAGRHQLVVPLARSETPLRDRRLARPLDAGKYHVGTRRAAALAKGAEASIESVIDADWRAFTTLAEAHQFLYGVTGDPRMNDFLPLLDWPSLDEPRKLALLSEHASHELHLFLARKDPDFFAKHVKPLLAEKREPTVIDDILLGRDLAPYLRPYAWQRLNAAEKALLAQAMPEAKDRIAAELKQRWEFEAPTPEQETMLFTQTLRGTDLATEDSLGLARKMPGKGFGTAEDFGDGWGTAQTGRSSRILEKLNSIIVPVINFEDTSVEEAIDFLRLRSIELDANSLDPTDKGMNFVIRKPRGGVSEDAGLDADAGGLGAAQDPGSLRIDELNLRNVPIGEALKYICDKTKLRYKIDEYAITIVPATETDEDLFTRSFRVPPDFLSKLAGGAAWADPNDPFAPDEGSTLPVPHKSEVELLKDNGVKFPEGSSAKYFRGSSTLLVRNTPTNLDLIEQITGVLESRLPGVPEDTGDPFAQSSAYGLDSQAPSPAMEPAADPFMDPFAGKPRSRPSWSSERDQTRLWRESNYYKHRGDTGEKFIPLNRFWLDLAAWDGKGGFLSPHFNACTHNANEALFCLAMLDLPFAAARPETRVDGATLRVKAREPMLLFYKDTRETGKVAPDAPVLVRQTFHRLDDRFRTEDGRKIENSITGDFLAGVPYGASLVVTNPTGAGRRIDVLAQIPAGSIPLDGMAATASTTHELEPYGVLNLRLAFYFPAAGEFALYPLQVSEGDLVLARTPVRTLKATAEAPPVDAASWPALARDGSSEQVLERLRSASLQGLDFKLIRWRLKDGSFFHEVAQVLRERLVYSPDVASYGFLHGSVPAMRDYLEDSLKMDAVLPEQIKLELGDWLDSPLLEVRPVEHRGWETLEFDPLVNPRAHRFADKERLTHEEAKSHYERFLDNLAWKPALGEDDRLALTYHLLLQDRVEEALAHFDAIKPELLGGRLAYDYVTAVVDFYRSRPEDARAIARRHDSLPPGLWKSRFEAVILQADEIVALQQPRAVEPEKPEEEAPSLDLALATDGKLMVKHHRLDRATLQLFSVDLEVMFSKDPFLSGEATSLPGIMANDTREVPLPAEEEETGVELPEGFRQGNVLVAARSGGTRVLKVLDSRALETVRQPLDRTIQVYDSASRLPLPRSYVKVYVQGPDGSAEFHKDGYTDLRGKFDYLSHTGSELGEIRKVAVLISHPEKGSRVEVFDL
ncbi:hypothetical protein [Luteolibacter marinus]|uniref:hypothetical protein n=1 Tax=Luteolibacter marinus TaxID=2776705 RepID=UPI0018664373|nr:hypothetical protein [Luteolibacter marinus]